MARDIIKETMKAVKKTKPGDCVFTRVNHKRDSEKLWERYDGFDGRFCVCVTKYHGRKNRRLQVFNLRSTANEAANKYAPLICLEEEDCHPVGVRLEMSTEAQKIYVGGGKDNTDVLAAVLYEMDVALLAADTICKQFIEPFYEEQKKEA